MMKEGRIEPTTIMWNSPFVVAVALETEPLLETLLLRGIPAVSAAVVVEFAAAVAVALMHHVVDKGDVVVQCFLLLLFRLLSQQSAIDVDVSSCSS